MLFRSQTLPQNTLAPVDAVINPQLQGPNAGLPGPISGRRYLIVEDIGSPGNSTISWGTLIAKANDIIEYDAGSSSWFVSFDASQSTSVQYVTNLTTSIQYRYVQAEGQWMKSYEGWYDQGDYSIVI